MLYDCSPLLDAGLSVWPGDQALERRVACRIEEGASVTLSALHATVHLGSHADAPSHYVAGGRAIDDCALNAYLGAARVLSVGAGHLDGERRILPTVLEGRTEELPPRVLFRTVSFDPRQPYDDTFASFHPGTIDALAALGVVLIGIDTPSMDPLRDSTLASHKRLAHHGILNLEGLILEHVPDGDYELIALPLRLAGFDASPVRCVLRSL